MKIFARQQELHQYDFPIPLYEIIPTTAHLQDLAREAASILADRTEVPTKEKETKVFEYRWTEACANVVREFSHSSADYVKNVLVTRARVKIPMRKPDEARPIPSLLTVETGRLHIRENQVGALIFVQTSEEAKLGETELLAGSIILIFGDVHFGMEPADIFILQLFPTLPLGLNPAEQAEPAEANDYQMS